MWLYEVKFQSVCHSNALTQTKILKQHQNWTGCHGILLVWLICYSQLERCSAMYLVSVQSNPQRSFEIQSQQLNVGLGPLISYASKFSIIILTMRLGCIPSHRLSNNLDGIIKYSDIVRRNCWFSGVRQRRVCFR